MKNEWHLFYLDTAYNILSVITTIYTYRISSNRSRVSNTSRGSDCICSNRSRGLTANTVGLMVLVIGPWCVASFVTYCSTYWYLIMASDVQKSHICIDMGCLANFTCKVCCQRYYVMHYCIISLCY